MKRTLRLLVLACLALALMAGSALGQEFDKESYPQEVVKRPLEVAPGMVELEVGAGSDFAAAQSADQVTTLFELRYGVASRMQLELESRLAVAPTEAFALDDVFVSAAYNVVPSLSIAGGFFAGVPAEGDATYGLRLGLPFKQKLSPATALVSEPQWSMQFNGPKLQILDVPLGVQLQAVAQFAFMVTTGVQVLDFEFTDQTVNIPFAAGLLFSPTRRFDIGAEFRVIDVSDTFDNRWVNVFLAIRR